MLYDRIVSIFILIPSVIFILFFFSTIQFLFFLFIVCLLSAWEWGKLMNFSLKMQYAWMCIMFGLLFFTTIIFFQNSLLSSFWCIFVYSSIGIAVWWIFMFLLILFYPYSSIYWNRSDILRFCFGILMILPFFCGVIVLHEFHLFIPNIAGKWWLLYILILVWINDSSAYVIGRTLGKYKLLKNISPQKTWEGCIGGILMSISAAWLLIKYFIEENIIDPYIIFISFLGAMLFAVIGDLSESMFKRESGVKDTNNFIPGHGGLLDRIDSSMSAIPIFIILMLSLIHMSII